MLAFAQQTKGVADRRLTPLQQLEIKVAKFEHFKTLVYRFEVAWEESEMQSMLDLKLELQKLMTENNQASPVAIFDDEKTAIRVLGKQQCLEKIEALPLSINDGAFGTKAEKLIALFQNYIQLVAADLADQSKAIQQAEKH